MILFAFNFLGNINAHNNTELNKIKVKAFYSDGDLSFIHKSTREKYRDYVKEVGSHTKAEVESASTQILGRPTSITMRVKRGERYYDEGWLINGDVISFGGYQIVQ